MLYVASVVVQERDPEAFETFDLLLDRSQQWHATSSVRILDVLHAGAR